MNVESQFGTLLKSWVQFQEEILAQCLNSQRGNAFSDWDETILQQPLELTGEWVNGLINKQNEFIQEALSFAEDKCSDPMLFESYFKTAKALVDNGAKTQQSLMGAYFASMKSFEGKSMPEAWKMSETMFSMKPLLQWNHTLNEMVQTWETTLENGVASQQDYLQQMLPDMAPKKVHVKARVKPATDGDTAASHH